MWLGLAGSLYDLPNDDGDSPGSRRAERSLRSRTAAHRMDIHFISSLTPDDEDRLAPAILEAIKPMLELMPIAYTIRIRTASNSVYQHTRTELAEGDHAADAELNLPLTS